LATEVVLLFKLGENEVRRRSNTKTVLFRLRHSPLSTLHSPLSTIHSPLSTLHYQLSTNILSFQDVGETKNSTDRLQKNIFLKQIVWGLAELG
ncbi:MAG: hypothetical protein LBC20_15750, partial [Planctomycetaceae bacterium]|jgi:hypothetical protein|nr:hypothetical protein [Planctomycetaceae bacterium]